MFVIGVVELIAVVALSLDLSLFALALPVTQNPWTVVLAVYAHGSVGHLLANSVALLLFGLLVERYTTTTRFHTFFIVSGIVSGLSETVMGVVFGNPVAVIGASGSIFALMGYFLTGNVATDRFLDSVEMGWKSKGVFVLITAGLLTQATASPGVALVAHFSGLVLGIVAGRFRILHVD